MEDPRPHLSRPLERLLAALCRDVEELRDLDPTAILVVAVSAHSTAAASVRSFDAVARSVRVEGHDRRWELALRPPFFLTGDPGRRLATLVHELLHLDGERPGRLREDRRHRVHPHEAHERLARALARQWLQGGDLELLAPLGHDGEVLLRQWRHRPVPATRERAFTGRDLFAGPVPLRTPRRARTVWW